MGAIKEEPGAGDFQLSSLVNKKSKFFHMFKFMDKNYNGDIERLFKGSNNVFDLATTLRPKGNLNKIIKFGKYGLPAAVFVAEFGFKIKNYIKDIGKKNLSQWDKRQIQIKKLLEMTDTKTDAYSFTPEVGREIVLWLLSKPKTKAFKILEVYDQDEGQGIFKKVSSTKSKIHDSCVLYIFLEYKKIKIVWRVEFYKALATMILENSTVYFDNTDVKVGKKTNSFSNDLIVEYIQSFDIEKMY